MKANITAVAVGVFLALVAANYYSKLNARAIEFIDCQTNRNTVEEMTGGKGTLTFGLWDGCNLVRKPNV